MPTVKPHHSEDNQLNPKKRLTFIRARAELAQINFRAIVGREATNAELAADLEQLGDFANAALDAKLAEEKNGKPERSPDPVSPKAIIEDHYRSFLRREATPEEVTAAGAHIKAGGQLDEWIFNQPEALRLYFPLPEGE